MVQHTILGPPRAHVEIAEISHAHEVRSNLHRVSAKSRTIVNCKRPGMQELTCGIQDDKITGFVSDG